MFSRSLRLLSQLTSKKIHKVNAVRNSSDVWVYREGPPPATRWRFITADIISAFTWWWIFIHLYYQPGHVLGEYEYPNPDKFTDKELGIVDFEELE